MFQIHNIKFYIIRKNISTKIKTILDDDFSFVLLKKVSLFQNLCYYTFFFKPACDK